jgi:hypothetical protein
MKRVRVEDMKGIIAFSVSTDFLCWCLTIKRTSERIRRCRMDLTDTRYMSLVLSGHNNETAGSFKGLCHQLISKDQYC